jgi:peptidoglycan/xylan/chitin deacetylase (PgdA/CDA1 family)
MYFNKNNNFFHGIMFHHFHNDNIHTRGQGSISKDEFYKLINFVGRKNILDADVFFDKFKQNKLKENEVCLTFDDGIKCQIDVALPVLEDLKVKSFFFVYTSILEGKPDSLEIFRYFRMNFFDCVDDFYKNFYEVLNHDLTDFFSHHKNNILNKQKRYPFYTIEDIKFRLVRDRYLKKSDYKNILFNMMKEKKFEYKQILSNLIFDKNDLILLNSLGHVIGLHSHSHPLSMQDLSYDKQKFEYQNCVDIISKTLKKPSNSFKTASHPLGSYNQNSLEILKELGIELAFKDSMKIEREKGMKKINNSPLEIAREDHAEIIKRMN